MPYPIRKTREQFSQNESGFDQTAQDMSSLIPFLQQPYSLLQQMATSDKDKEKIKKIWMSSETNEDKTLAVASSVDQRDIDEMKSKGFIRIVDNKDRLISLTARGKKILNEAVLDSGSSFTKSASKKLISKNSYDFGKEVLVRVNKPEKFGTKYITVKKSMIEQKGAVPQTIDNYSIKTKNEDGSYRKLSQYNDEELIKVLHLAKRILNNAHKIRIAGSTITKVPVHKIHAFAELIMKELNRE